MEPKPDNTPFGDLTSTRRLRIALATIGFFVATNCDAPKHEHPLSSDPKSSENRVPRTLFKGAKLAPNQGQFGVIWADGRYAKIVSSAGPEANEGQHQQVRCTTIPYASEQGFLCSDRPPSEFNSSLLGVTPLSNSIVPDASMKIAISSQGDFAAYSAGHLQYIVDGQRESMDLEFPIIPTRKEELLSIFDGPDPFKSSKVKTKGRLSNPQHLTIVGDSLFFGFGAGEFGGWVATYQLKSGQWTVLDTEYPVTALHEANHGGVWIVASSGHGRPSARILMYREGKVTSLIDTNTWHLGPAIFTGISESKNGSLYVASHQLGLVRNSQGNWEQLDKGWIPSYVYDFALVDDRAYILLKNDITVVELASGVTTTIRLTTLRGNDKKTTARPL